MSKFELPPELMSRVHAWFIGRAEQRQRPRLGQTWIELLDEVVHDLERHGEALLWEPSGDSYQCYAVYPWGVKRGPAGEYLAPFFQGERVLPAAEVTHFRVAPEGTFLRDEDRTGDILPPAVGHVSPPPAPALAARRVASAREVILDGSLLTPSGEAIFFFKDNRVYPAPGFAFWQEGDHVVVKRDEAPAAGETLPGVNLADLHVEPQPEVVRVAEDGRSVWIDLNPLPPGQAWVIKPLPPATEPPTMRTLPYHGLTPAVIHFDLSDKPPAQTAETPRDEQYYANLLAQLKALKAEPSPLMGALEAIAQELEAMRMRSETLATCPEGHHLKDGPCKRDYCRCPCPRCEAQCREGA